MYPRLTSFLLAAASLAAQSTNTNLITTFAGTEPSLGAGVDALATPLAPTVWGKPAVDASGNIYFSIPKENIVVRLSPAGRLERFAGNFFARFGGDGGRAQQASLNNPRDVAVDSRGNIYIADAGNRRIRRVLPSGIIETFAGGGTVTPSANGVPSKDAALTNIYALAIDGVDNIYCTIDNYSIGRIDWGSSQVRLFSGRPGTAGAPQNGTAASTQYRFIASLSADKGGNLFLADSLAISVIKIWTSGRVEILTTRSATFGAPLDVAVDPSGAVYFTQNASPVIWRLNTNNSVEIYAGNAANPGFSPAGTPRERALFGAELRVGVDGKGGVLVGDLRNARLRRVTATVDPLAGTDLLYSGEAGPATAAVFHAPGSIAQNRAGTVYFSDADARVVFSVDTRGILRRFAGSGVLNAPYIDGRAALEGAFGTPFGVAVDAAGNVYVADEDCAIRRIGSDGAMRIHAGSPNLCGNTRDGATLKDMRFGQLRGLTIDAAGNMFVTDITNHKVWRIGSDGVVRTFAGTGQPGTTTTSLPAVQAPLNTPTAVAVAPDGAVYIADQQNNRVARVGSDGRLTSFVGVGQRASTGDNGPASSAAVNSPTGLVFDAQGNLFISEFNGHRVRRVSTSGTITTYAGTGAAGGRGDGGFAISAQLNSPAGLLINSAGELLIADRENGRIRRVLNGAPSVKFSTSPVTISLAPGDFVQRGTLPLSAPVPGLAFEASVRLNGTDTSWLTVSPARGTLPATLSYETNSAGLPAGDYTGNIVITVSSATPRETLIPVTLRVPAPPTRPWFNGGNSRLTLSAIRGATATHTIPVTNPGASPITIRGAASRGTFLTVSPESLTIAPGQTSSFSIIASSGTLAVGTYAGAVTLTGSNSTATVNVSFNVAAARSRFTISQTGLSFRAVAGGSTPPDQFIYAAPAERVIAQASTLSGTPWLSATVSDNKVTVSVSPRELPAGDHYGRIVIADAATPAVRQTATVLLQVLPAGSDPGPDVYPSALLYTATSGGEVAGQEVEFVLPTNRKASFTTTGATFEGQPWLEFSPAGGSVSGDTPGRVTVQPDVSGLAPGVYRGSVTLTLDDGQSRTVAILAIVNGSAAAAAKGAPREAGSCSNQNLFPQVLSPAAGFRATIGEPVRLAARVVDGCGNPHQPEGGATTGVAVTGLGSQVVNLNHIGAGVWEATVTPNAIQSPLTLTFLGIFSRGTFLQAGAEKLNGAIVTAQRPVVFSESLTDAASFQFGVPVAPGTLVSLFGANLNNNNAIPNSLPLPNKLNDVEVRLNDTPIPLLFAGPGQVNAQIPYSLAPDADYQLEIRRGSSITTPQSVVIAQARPGVFTVDQSGQGQGHIYRALPDGSQRLADAANPTAAGEVLVIYCNGLGATTPAVNAGEAAPFSPLAVTAAPVTVTIGNQNAPILFAGLAPGFTGLYQINAQVPAGITPGGAVQMVLTAAGQSSVPVTLGVR